MSKIYGILVLLLLVLTTNLFALSYLQFEYTPLAKESIKSALDKFVKPKFHDRAYLGMISRIQKENPSLKNEDMLDANIKVTLYVDQSVADSAIVQAYIDLITESEEKLAEALSKAEDDIQPKEKIIHNLNFRPSSWQFDLSADLSYKYNSFQTSGPTDLQSADQQSSQYHKNVLAVTNNVNVGLTSWLDIGLSFDYGISSNTTHTALLLDGESADVALRDPVLKAGHIGDLSLMSSIRLIDQSIKFDMKFQYYHPIGGSDFLDSGALDKKESFGNIVPKIEITPVLTYQWNPDLILLTSFVVRSNLAYTVNKLSSVTAVTDRRDARFDFRVSAGGEYRLFENFYLGSIIGFEQFGQQTSLLSSGVRLVSSTKSLVDAKVYSTVMLSSAFYFKMGVGYGIYGDRIFLINDVTDKTDSAHHELSANLGIGIVF